MALSNRRVGEGIQAGLGQADYSGFLAGASQGAQSMGKGISALGAGIGAGIQMEKEADKQFNKNMQTLRNMKQMYSDDPETVDQIEAVEADIMATDSMREKRGKAASVGDFLRGTQQRGIMDFQRDQMDQQNRQFLLGHAQRDRAEAQRTKEADRGFRLDRQVAQDIQDLRVGQNRRDNLAFELREKQVLADLEDRNNAAADRQAAMRGGLAAVRALRTGEEDLYGVTDSIIDKMVRAGEIPEGLAYLARANAYGSLGQLSKQPAPSEFDKKMQGELATKLAAWESGGKATTEEALNNLKAARDIDIATGPVQGRWPESLPFIGRPNTRKFRRTVEKEVFKSLKEILGAQFAQKEAERLLEQYYDPLSSEEINKAGLDSMINEIQGRVDSMNSMRDQYRETGSVNWQTMGGGGAAPQGDFSRMGEADLMRNLDNVKKKSREPAVDLQSSLPKPLKPYAKTFEEEGRKHGLDPAFLASIAMLETGGGTSSAFRNKRNAMGVSNSKGPISFKRVEDSIARMARVLANPKGPYRGATTIPQIGAVYAPPGAGNDPRKTNSYWPTGVSKFYRQLGGNPALSVYLR